MELSILQGVGKARLTAMHAAGIFSLRDLLYTFPQKYKDASTSETVAEAQAGQRAVFCLRRMGEPKVTRYGKTSKVSCTFVDDTGEMTAIWFNQPWMKENLMKRTQFLLFGLVSRFGGKLQLQNPSVEDAARIVPVYRQVEGLPQKTHENICKQALLYVEQCCEEGLWEDLRQRHGLMGIAEAIRILHDPQRMEDIAKARRRMAFEQMLLYQIAVRLVKDQRRRGMAMQADDPALEAYWRSLSFMPTKAQRRTLGEVAQDMKTETAMARMVQGDVGCGKTAIAIGAILLCVKSGYQAALMAPTEILARQHYEGTKRFFEKQGLTCGLLVGGLPAKERRETTQSIASGAWQVVIGTHALISKDVTYASLGLCVTDEQHRFGVGQRTALLNKGKQGSSGKDAFFPHLLVMSATPIPRTLALVMFGDLDISVVDELPPGRIPVTTRIVPEEKRADMYRFLRKELTAGQQAYIVCPLVEESEEMDALKAVKTHFAELEQGELKGFSIGLTHGKQSAAEKEKTIQAFARGDTQVLIATTVIEVGVNVPGATVMLIEDADRYGLAQLHQLRGRVGRGAMKSWCFLLAKENERLRALTQTNDGFEIARKDLELRGPGEILGTAQHGAGDGLCSPALMGDMNLLYEVAECARELEGDSSRAQEWEAMRRQAAAYLGKVSETVSMS